MTQSVIPTGGNGFTLVRRKGDGELKLNIAHWSPDVVAVLESLRPPHIEQVGAWDRDNPVLRHLAPFGNQIRSFLSSEKPLADIQLLAEWPNLESLTLQVPAEEIDFGKLGSLLTLNLWKGSTFGRANQAPGIRNLLLWSMGAKDVRMLGGMASLRELELRQMLGVKSLAGIESLQLVKLDLTYVNRLESLAPIGSLRHLEVLDISGASKAKAGEELAGAAALRAIKFDNGPVLPALDMVSEWKGLERFEFWGTSIGEGPCSVAPLAASPKLTDLVLSGRPRSLNNLTEIEALGQAKSLRVLKLDRVPDLENLHWVRGLKELREFSLWGSRVKDGDLSPILDLPELIWLSLNLSDSKGKPKYTPSVELLVEKANDRRAQATKA